MSESSLNVFHVELPNTRSNKYPSQLTTTRLDQSCHFGASRDFTASKKQASTASGSSQSMGPHADKTKTATATYSFTLHPWDLWHCCLFCLLPPVCQILGRKEPLQWSPEFWMHQVAVPKDSMVNVRSCTGGSKDLTNRLLQHFPNLFLGICSKSIYHIQNLSQKTTPM